MFHLENNFFSFKTFHFFTIFSTIQRFRFNFVEDELRMNNIEEVQKKDSSDVVVATFLIFLKKDFSMRIDLN